MGFQPRKGVRPPQLEGRRTGRPKGTKNYARHWADVIWAFEHRYEERASPPTRTALLWWYFACRYPDEFEEWLYAFGKI
jgi:hypothetical protein